MSGFAHVTGEANGPPTLPPFALADHVAALYGAFGALVSLYLRDARGGGKGQVIDVSLLESLFSALGVYLVEYDQLGLVPQRQGNRTASAPRNTYPTADGRWIAVAGSTQSVTARLFRAIGRPELEHDPRFRSNRDRLQNVEELDRIVTEWVAARSQQESIETLLAAEVAAAPVLDVRDLATDPHLAAREAIAMVEDEQLGRVRLPNVQPRLAGTPGAVRHAGPPVGAHTDEILGELLRLSPAEIDDLRQRGVV
jgi:crotonobetainyl-CoA:carnitine CoA-transferase CaiB-like acyl-CoA transferase